MSKNVRRLYKNFQPEHYQLYLACDRDNMKFSGQVSIRGRKIGRPSNRLTLHQKDLKITNAKITNHSKNGDAEVSIERVNTQKSFDEVRLHTTELMYPGSYSVELSFEGIITEPMSGIYPSFFEYEGKKQILITTQFESHHAREAFPCIDEPEAKATFDLSIVVPKDEAAMANTPIKSQRIIEGANVVHFETTPKMSTYLLAFNFGNLEYKEAKTRDNVTVRTYATPDNVQFTPFALEFAVRCLEFYNDYFDIPYPLEKCDLIALPDFAAGAMENWGCINFREQAMLMDPKNTSLYIKQRVCLVIAHELAHQWFGNLVTMKWWTDLWLNEGFASWIEHLAVDHLYPNWGLWTQFTVEETAPAFQLDALGNSHPIEVEVTHPDEIRTIFDTISYSKGGSVINMLHRYLGPELFRDGLIAYLKKYAYSNADTNDLWTVLEEKTKMPIIDFMNTWTSKTGFPIIFASINKADIDLRQERFYINPASQKHNPDSTVWPIPLLIVPEDHQLFTQKTSNLPMPKTKLVKLNRGETGFYRVSYNSEHLSKLAEEVAAGKFEDLDRVGIVSDAFEAAKAGFIKTVEPLHLLASYKHEDSPVVWDIIARNLSTLRRVMNDDALRERMKPFIIKITAEQLNRLGWEEIPHESHFDRLLRPTIIGMAAIADEPSVLKEIHRQFREMKNSEDIHPDMRSVVYNNIARDGGTTDYNKLLRLYHDTNSSEERVILSSALTGFKHSALIIRSLDLIISDSVRLQDATYWLAYSFLNRYAKTATWEWMTDHWDWLEENLGDDLSFPRFPLYSASAFSDISFLPTYRKFFKKVSSPVLERSVKQGVEIIQWQSAWRHRDIRGIKQFFKN